jgi:hypothetical protein
LVWERCSTRNAGIKEDVFFAETSNQFFRKSDRLPGGVIPPIRDKDQVAIHRTLAPTVHG